MHDKSGNPPENTELYRDLPPPFDDAFSSSSRAPFRTHFACITLNRRDRIRFLNFPPDVVRDMAGVIRSAWPRGIDSERAYNKALEIKVYGNPWGTDRAGDDDARRLVRRLLEGLYDRGWVLQAAVDITKKELDKDTQVFRYQSPPPPPCDWITVSFDRDDRLKFVDTPPQDIIAALLQTYGISVSSSEQLAQHFEIKFRGRPWWPSGEDTVETPFILIKLLETMEMFGFSLYMSLGQQNSQDGHDVDVLIMHRQKNWVPGMPVWHR